MLLTKERRSAEVGNPALSRMLLDGRRRAGLSQRELAGRLAINFTYVCRVERVRHVPGGDLLLRWAETLNLNPDAVLAEAGQWPKSVRDYAREHPDAIRLMQRLARMNASEEVIRRLIEMVDQMEGSE